MSFENEMCSICGQRKEFVHKFLGDNRNETICYDCHFDWKIQRAKEKVEETKLNAKFVF